MDIGLKIKELASENKITLAALATKLGKTKQAVYEMVEKKDVSTSILRDLSRIFNVPICYFFDEEDRKSAVANGAPHGGPTPLIGRKGLFLPFVGTLHRKRPPAHRCGDGPNHKLTR